MEQFLATHGRALRAHLGGLAHNGRQQTIAEEVASDVLHLCSLPTGSVATGERLSLERYSGKGSLGAWLRSVAHFRFVNAVRRSEHRRTILSADLDEANPIDSLQHTPAPEPEIDPEWLNVIRGALRDAVARSGQESPEGIVFLRLVHMHDVQRQRLAHVWKRHPAQVTRRLKESQERIRTLTLDALAELDPHFDLRWEDLLAAIAASRAPWYSMDTDASGKNPEENN